MQGLILAYVLAFLPCKSSSLSQELVLLPCKASSLPMHQWPCKALFPIWMHHLPYRKPLAWMNDQPCKVVESILKKISGAHHKGLPWYIWRWSLSYINHLPWKMALAWLNHLPYKEVQLFQEKLWKVSRMGPSLILTKMKPHMDEPSIMVEALNMNEPSSIQGSTTTSKGKVWSTSKKAQHDIYKNETSNKWTIPHKRSPWHGWNIHHARKLIRFALKEDVWSIPRKAHLDTSEDEAFHR